MRQNGREVINVQDFWNDLLNWFEKNERHFPWRETSDPFHVLTAEFLLQQTHVRKVQQVYEKLTADYPTPKRLAEADIRDVEEIIQPIGLIYRAERLKRSAEVICRDYSCRVPDNPGDLKKLPGVGPYICDAVLCYAYGCRTVPIDTNVIRVFSRCFNLVSDKARPRTDPILAEKIRLLFKEFKNTRMPNLAVLDFAAAVCTAKNPKCGQCPLSGSCYVYN